MITSVLDCPGSVHGPKCGSPICRACAYARRGRRVVRLLEQPCPEAAAAADDLQAGPVLSRFRALGSSSPAGARAGRVLPDAVIWGTARASRATSNEEHALRAHDGPLTLRDGSRGLATGMPPRFARFKHPRDWKDAAAEERDLHERRQVARGSRRASAIVVVSRHLSPASLLAWFTLKKCHRWQALQSQRRAHVW